jgi:hypothetical protein
MFSDFTLWELIPWTFFGFALHASVYRRKVGESRFQNKTVNGYMALAAASYLVIDTMVKHDKGQSVLDAAFLAIYLYAWWNSGGGDGIKNFLQSLVMKPAHAVR